MDAVLRIYGDIGTEEGGISSSFVSDFLDKNKDATDITVKINSRGGDVQEGWTIYDLLVNSGKKITTIGEGQVYSIATIIFLAGSTREMMINANGEIHNPYIPPFTLADSYESKDLLKLAEGLAQEEAKILDFYVSKTKGDKAKLAEYMAADTKLSADEMLNLGFATKVIEPVKAYAYINFKNNIMDAKDVKTFGEKLDIIISKLGLSKNAGKGQTLTDKDGKNLTLTKDTGAPAVGDQATPDGTFTMANGDVIVVAGGVITSLGSTAMGDEMTPSSYQKLKVENEKMKSELAAAQAEKIAMDAKISVYEGIKAQTEAEKVALEAEKVKTIALVAELSSLKNSWVPDSRSKFSSREKVGEIDMNRVKEINEKLKK